MSTLSMRPRPTDAEFDELKRKRDDAVAAVVARVCAEQGWDSADAYIHHSHSSECYCACPDGPCQHIWDGEPWTDDNSYSTTCSRCGEVAMFHDMRCGP